MPKIVRSESNPLPWTLARGTLLLTTLGLAWARFDPASFPVMELRLAGAAAITGAAGVAAWALWPRHPITPTHEDWACGVYITGLPGSGKTAWA